MKSGALVFLVALFALAGSWGGFVLAPQVQLGDNVQTNMVATGDLYPQARPGEAKQGLEVYRANGCVYCHTQQVGQDGTRCDVVLTDAGTNATAALAVAVKLNPDLTPPRGTDLKTALAGLLKKTIVTVRDMDAADAAVKSLEKAGAKAEARIEPFGPDIARGWGKRRTVAQDYLFDYPVQLGSIRIGPDLANIGLRRPSAEWQLLHLYAPQAVVQGSTMPPYHFLFEKRKVGAAPSPDALPLPAAFAPPPGYEIVPKPGAKMLVAYLQSLKADAPLFVAPVTIASMNASATNAPAK